MVHESKRLEFIVCKKGNSPTVCPITSLGQNNTYILLVATASLGSNWQSGKCVSALNNTKKRLEPMTFDPSTPQPRHIMNPQCCLTCCSLLLRGSGWDSSEGKGQDAEASEVLRGVLDDPGVRSVHQQQRGRAVLQQLERVPLTVRQHGVAHRPLHLPPDACIRDIVDVPVPQLGEEKADRLVMSTSPTTQNPLFHVSSTSTCVPSV